MSRIALIAGAGDLPRALVRALSGQGSGPMVCAPEGVMPEGLAVDTRFRFERLVPFLRHLGDSGIRQVVLAGAIHRPIMDPALFDRETAGLVPGMVAALAGGDDAALRWVIGVIESFDLEVVGLSDLAPSLLVSGGVLTARAPSVQEAADAERGQAILAAMAAVDVGQGCVVASGLCLAIEAVFGTDAMLADVARHRPTRTPQTGGVFVKRSKAGQDLRADLPTIGPATIPAAKAAGLSAICLQAGHVLVLDRAAVVAAADAADMALWAVP
ncbi:LpxI family protein [Pararhodobacter sp.]|uniref:LpxI family protein n=1 Tax=Pararhodobacter sp. TaxID=2127056 RepID=UPI002B00091B|nr:UDP-2,3-diacylglucosamine diphosphatase LpxI [Pararhodobacter sp.]